MKLFVPFLLILNLSLLFVFTIKLFPPALRTNYHIGDCLKEKLNQKTYYWKVTGSTQKSYQITLISPVPLKETVEKPLLEINSSLATCKSS